MEHFHDAFKEIGKSLTSKVEVRPGWLFLLIFTYVAVGYWLPPRVEMGGWVVELSKLPNEVWAAAFTYVGYQSGNLVDLYAFKERYAAGVWDGPEDDPTALGTQRREASRALGVRTGSYHVSMKILEAAETTKRSLPIQLVNESAKFMRSLILPGLCAALGIAAHLLFRFGALLEAAAVLVIAVAVIDAVAGAAYLLAWHLYPRMKVWHIRRLYQTVRSIIEEEQRRLPEKRRLCFEEVGGVKLFFWEGALIASARR
jgi:hypothetical protein